MRSGTCGLGNVADRALTDCSGVPLDLHELDRIIGFPAGGNRMRAIVASLAIDTSMTG